jgi:sugar lactone lactonase YvrE
VQVIAAFCAVSVCLAAAAADQPRPAFTRAPTAVRVGERVRIDFAVDRPTDVAVFVQDARGRIVRHLAAGVLGKNPPAPLKAGSLAQSIAWDRRDDRDRPVARRDGPFKVRVALGLTPTFAKMLGHNPADLGGVRGMAVGPRGEVYVIHSFGSHHPHDGSAAIAVLSREGKYLRTIAPFPADLPAARLAGLRHLRLANGSRVPYVFQGETRSCLPGLGDLPSHQPVVTSDGRLAFVGVHEGPRPFAQPGQARLTVIGTDGGAPAGGVLQTRIHPLTDTAASLALSPDEKTLYAAGVRAGTHLCLPGHDFTCEHCDHRGSTWAHTVPVHCVFRFRWGDPHAAVYIGNPARAGDEPSLLDEPVAVACDGEGNVYVADTGNDRIAVFAPGDRSAEPLAQVKVAAPQRVAVHRRTGAIYVLSGDREVDLVKLDGYRSGREVWRRRLYRSRRRPSPIRRPCMALDDRVDPPILWLGRPLSRIVDRGKRPGEPLDLRSAEWMGPPAMASVMEMSLDRDRGMLYVNNARRYDVRSWTAERLNLPARGMWPNSYPGSASGRLGRDGSYYLHRGAARARVLRFGADLKPRPFPNSTRPDGVDTEGALCGYARDHTQGHTADAAGNVYVLWKKGADQNQPGDAHRAYCLSVYRPDGSLKAERLVDASIPGLNSIRVDPAGNLYLAVAVRPHGGLVPPGLEGQVPDAPTDPDAVNGVNMYPMMYGSIIKFPPTGGIIREGAGGVRCRFAFGRPIDVKGARWIVPGVSVVNGYSAPKRHPGTIISCVCETPCMDVDDFGRTFFPDAGRARFGVLDTAGNVIGWFGRYGNPDSTGADGRIPLWWPQALAVGDAAVYIGDRLNRRILAARLTYKTEATCEVTRPQAKP